MKAPDPSAAELAAMELYIDKFLNPIAEPVRKARCHPFILAQAKKTQARRHVFTDASGVERERMPMGVISASYFLRAGKVWPMTILDILYRRGPSTSAAGPPPSAGIPPAGSGR